MAVLLGAISKIALTKRYGPYAAQVLLRGEYLEDMKSSSKVAKYKILKPLPGKESFRDVFNRVFSKSIGDLISDAFGIFEELAEEMGDWYESLPESLQSTDKASTIEETRDALYDMQAREVSDHISNMKVVYTPPRKVKSRSDRCNDACGMLQAVEDYLNDLDDNEELTSEDRDECQSLASDLEEVRGRAEDLEFPGMYG